jgi:hypothetical protein
MSGTLPGTAVHDFLKSRPADMIRSHGMPTGIGINGDAPGFDGKTEVGR